MSAAHATSVIVGSPRSTPSTSSGISTDHSQPRLRPENSPIANTRSTAAILAPRRHIHGTSTDTRKTTNNTSSVSKTRQTTKQVGKQAPRDQRPKTNQTQHLETLPLPKEHNPSACRTKAAARKSQHVHNAHAHRFTTGTRVQKSAAHQTPQQKTSHDMLCIMSSIRLDANRTAASHEHDHSDHDRHGRHDADRHDGNRPPTRIRGSPVT
ncbi:hypothetical protein PSRA_1764 [Pseudoscardovia radai]|uniref:Uncharacterized protein n=1 Tax=Pseudoscardovia radai TaxID=987066 RepID=A0A261EPG9_9BIFI|nr:hypothetical protein PSRA_1764 [Pseudoscardovia radai]